MDNDEIKIDKKDNANGSKVKKAVDYFSTIIIAVAVALLLNIFVFTLIQVNKTSMYPTLNDGDVVFLNKTAYWFSKPKSGDIIVFKRAESDGTKINYVKRVIGLPGDTIEIKNGNVYRNGVKLNEPYLIVITEDELSVTVPENKYFVMGDNRNVSLDSKSETIGFIDISEIMGKVVFKTRPLEGIDKYVHDYADN